MSDFHVYDTTLRDGAQQEGLSLSVQDKLAIARHLDDLGGFSLQGIRDPDDLFSALPAGRSVEGPQHQQDAFAVIASGESGGELGEPTGTIETMAAAVSGPHSRPKKPR